MTKPKLTYFDFPGSRGEEVRLALHIAGVEFEDHRIEGGSWPGLKARTPFGSLPVFEVEGHPPLGHSNAILAFVGRGHGLLPSDSWESARHEALMCAVEELRGTVMPVLGIKGDEAPAARKELAEGYLQEWGGFVEAQLGDGPFAGGSEISVADIKLYMASRWFSSGSVDHVPADVFAPFPKLVGIGAAVAAHPRVVDWYARS